MTETPWGKLAPQAEPVTTELASHPCPHCGGELTGATSATDQTSRPKPGDWSVCVYCCGALVFGQNLKTRKPTKDEIILMNADHDFLRSIRAARKVHRERANAKKNSGPVC